MLICACEGQQLGCHDTFGKVPWGGQEGHAVRSASPGLPRLSVMTCYTLGLSSCMADGGVGEGPGMHLQDPSEASQYWLIRTGVVIVMTKGCRGQQ